MVRVLTAGAALLLLLSGCRADPEQPSPPDPTQTAGSPTPSESPPESPSPSPSTPAATEPTATPSATEAQGTDTVLVFWVRAGARGEFVEPEQRQLAAPTLAVAHAAFTELLTGEPENPQLTSMVPAGTRLLDVARDGRVLTVDLSGELADESGSSAQERLLAEQLAHTAAQFPTVNAVTLRVDGQPVTDLWGHLDWSQPLTPDADALAPIIITDPAGGETVAPGSVTVAGTANVFEATVGLRLFGPDGSVAQETFTTATCGTGCRGTWEHIFDDVEQPGTWTIEASEDDASGGEGPGPFVTETSFQIG